MFLVNVWIILAMKFILRLILFYQPIPVHSCPAGPAVWRLPTESEGPRRAAGTNPPEPSPSSNLWILQKTGSLLKTGNGAHVDKHIHFKISLNIRSLNTNLKVGVDSEGFVHQPVPAWVPWFQMHDVTLGFLVGQGHWGELRDSRCQSEM